MAYTLPDGRVIFVSKGLSEDSYGIFYRKVRADHTLSGLKKYNGQGLLEMFPTFHDAWEALREYSAARKYPWSDWKEESVLSASVESEKKMETKTLIDSARNTTYRQIPLAKISPSPLNPRKHFDAEGLRELAGSIATHGLLEPIVVRARADQLNSYWIIAGERRYRAAVLAGLESIAATVRECDDREHLELALVENLQRRDIDPIEEAAGYRQLMYLGYKQAEIGEKVHRSQPSIANALRLLELPEDVRGLIQAGKLSVSHGKALCRWAAYPALLNAIAQAALGEHWTTKELESCDFIPSRISYRLHGVKCYELTAWNEPKTPFDWKTLCAGCADLKVKYCLNVACWRDKLKTHQASERARIDAVIAEQRAVATDAAPVVNARNLKAGDYKRLHRTPSGCEVTCPHRAVVKVNNEELPACLDPKCFEKLETKEKELVKAARKEKAEKKLARLDQVLAPHDDTVQRRALAVAIVRLIRQLDKKNIKPAIARLPVSEEMREEMSAEYYDYERQRLPLLSALSVLPVLDLVDFLARAVLCQEVTAAAHSDYSIETPLADWFLKREKAACLNSDSSDGRDDSDSVSGDHIADADNMVDAVPADVPLTLGEVETIKIMLGMESVFVMSVYVAPASDGLCRWGVGAMAASSKGMRENPLFDCLGRYLPKEPMVAQAGVLSRCAAVLAALDAVIAGFATMDQRGHGPAFAAIVKALIYYRSTAEGRFAEDIEDGAGGLGLGCLACGLLDCDCGTEQVDEEA